MSYEVSRKNQIVRRRFEARALLETLKRGPCHDCGLRFLPCQMDLVRPDGGGKPMAAFLCRSRATMAEEAEGRHLVCANCGRLRTWRRTREKRKGET